MILENVTYICDIKALNNYHQDYLRNPFRVFLFMALLLLQAFQFIVYWHYLVDQESLHNDVSLVYGIFCQAINIVSRLCSVG